MKFLRPNTDTKLEGYILGYGSSMFSKQFIQLPDNGQPYETEFGKSFKNKSFNAFYIIWTTDTQPFVHLFLDAEPKYLIAVQPILTNDVKKQCKGRSPKQTSPTK